MRFSCEGCSSKYMISDDKVGPGGVRVRCKKCGHVTLVRRGEPVAPAAPVARAAPVALAAPAGSVGVEWWVAIDEQPVGPVGVEVIQHHWDLGEIGPESLVWYADLPDWAPISTVPELISQLGGGSPFALPPVTAPPAPLPPAPPPPADEWRPGEPSPLAALEEPRPTGERAGSPFAPMDGPEPPAAPAPPDEPPSVLETSPVHPDPGPVKPLPMAGLERTGEHRVGSRSGARTFGAKDSFPPSSGKSRSLTVVLVAVLVVVVAIGAGLWWLTK